jgi:hypothetical protein
MATSTPSKPPPSGNLSPKAARQRRLQAPACSSTDTPKPRSPADWGCPARPPAAGMPAGAKAAARGWPARAAGAAPRLPDLNPVEGLWANLKVVELANRACRSLEELAAAGEQGIGRVRGESKLCSPSCTRQGFPFE